MESRKKVPLLNKIAYGVGTGGGCVFNQIAAAFLLQYYTDTALIGAAGCSNGDDQLVTTGEVHRGKAGIPLVGHFDTLGTHNGRHVVKGIGAVGHVEPGGKAGGIDFHVADAAAQRVHHQHGRW